MAEPTTQAPAAAAPEAVAVPATTTVATVQAVAARPAIPTNIPVGRFSLSESTLQADPAMQARMSSLLKQVGRAREKKIRAPPEGSLSPPALPRAGR